MEFTATTHSSVLFRQSPTASRGSVQRVPPPDPNLRRGWPERKSFGSLLGGTILEAGHPIGSNRRPAELHRIPTTAPPARQHGHVAGFARDVVVVPVRSAVDGSRLDERQHRGPAEAGDTRSRRTQHGTNQRRVTPSEATAGPQSSTKLGRRRLPPDNMDTLQASHATSSSFRLAPQSTAVASTRGNIVVPQNGTIYYDRPGCQSTGRYKYDHPGYQSTGRYTTIVPANPARTGRVRHECPFRSDRTAHRFPTRIPPARSRFCSRRRYGSLSSRPPRRRSRLARDNNTCPFRSDRIAHRIPTRIKPAPFQASLATSLRFAQQSTSSEADPADKARHGTRAAARPHEGGDVADPQSSPNPDVTSQPGHVERFRTRSGYRPVQISWKRFRSAVLRGTGRPGEEGRGENPAPLLYLEIVGTPESEYGKRRAPKGSGRRQHHRPTSAAGCRDRDSAGAPLFRFLRRYGESCASSERRDREPAAWTGPASGRDPGSAGAPPLPLRRNTTLQRHGESGASSERRDREPAAWTGPASGRDPGSAGAPPLPLRRNTTLERHGESGASSERRDREPAAWTGPASGRDPGSAGAPPLPFQRNTTLERHGESGASSERRDREPAVAKSTASCRDSDSAGARRVPFRSEAPARGVPRRNAGTASTPPGPGRATSRYTKTREGSSRALIRGPSTSFVHSHPAPRARGELLSNLGSAARSSTHLPLYRATGVPAILETFFVSGALRHDACRRGGEGTESRAVS
ncbi:hypothetical protein TNCT_475151 [Trichonephila clavata]|uniref:Uncharacterized protein n=1 Tax=Trichonephila clavata TaxID=2740835 RepID=A0A8X6LVU6_TRICU|nr:hypothetical protein TNCT_475151 [Trichonephila clavata]